MRFARWRCGLVQQSGLNDHLLDHRPISAIRRIVGAAFKAEAWNLFDQLAKFVVLHPGLAGLDRAER